MDRSITAGVSGFLLAIVINLFSPIYLYFVPSFLAAIFVIYIFRLGTFKDGLVAAFITYIFNEGILDTMGLATLYLASESYTLSIDVWIVFSPIVSSITALMAGYVGVWLSQKRKPAQELPPPIPPQSPPV
jgi:hypothetical protein